MRQEQLQQQVTKQKFKRFLFLHRVAFICNIFFIVCLIIRYTKIDTIVPQPLIQISALLGWIFSPIINIVCIALSLIIVLKNGKGISVPLWIIVSNIIIFGFEIFYFLLS